VTPRLLALDEGAHAVVLSDVVGEPLRASLLEARLDDCQRAGHALARWHTFWNGRRPGSLRAHSAHRELETLCRRAEAASSEVGVAAREAAERLSRPWGCATVVHRDLYEEQIMLGDRVGLIDLDDAALGPPELDIGNLVAHIELLSIRHRCDVAAAVTALLDGYTAAARLDPLLLNRCRRLSLLRLACLNDDRNLLSLALA
jgi:aminoglycoside phosphotransferase (APT) family kinase protein